MIRQITESDYTDYLTMVTEFYHSDAVEHPIPQDHIVTTFRELMKNSPYAECYLMEWEGKVAGYALLSKTFSQEAGGMVLWIEELYIRPEYQRKGLATSFFSMLEKKYATSTARYRLEIEDSNTGAIALYKRQGYKILGYSQMYKGK